MEKTNKCGVEYLCHGYLSTCKFALKVGEEKQCHYLVEGQCTCDQARKEATSEN